MVSVVKEQKADTLIIRLTGAIEESVDFDLAIGNHSPRLMVSTKGVPRINSVGVKAWIKYFQGLTQKGVQLVFFECSMAVVEQINLITNFLAGGAVESIYCPYLCSACGADYVVLFKTEDLRRMNLQLPPMTCTKCHSKDVQFDDIPEDYFYFLDTPHD